LHSSKQILEMESMELAQQNGILRAKISAKGQGPPGVWQPNVWTSMDPWCAWSHGAYDPWTEAQGYEYQAMLGQWGLAVTKDDDECSNASDQSTVDLSDSEDTADSVNSPTTTPEIDALDGSSDDGNTLSSSSSPRSQISSPLALEHCPSSKRHE